jgi:hypothetical protein
MIWNRRFRALVVVRRIMGVFLAEAKVLKDEEYLGGI